MLARRRRPVRLRPRPLAARVARAALRRRRMPAAAGPGVRPARAVRRRGGRLASRSAAICSSSAATSAPPRSILAARSATCCSSERSSLRREISPVAVCRGPTNSVPSAATTSQARLTKRQTAAGGFGQSQRHRPEFRRSRFCPAAVWPARRTPGPFRRIGRRRPTTPGWPARSICSAPVIAGNTSSRTKPTRPAGRPASRCKCSTSSRELATTTYCATSPRAASISGAVSMMDVEQIGHEAANLPEGTGRGLAGFHQHFFDAGADPFQAAFQLFEHGRPLAGAAVPFAPGGQARCWARGVLLAPIGQLRRAARRAPARAAGSGAVSSANRARCSVSSAWQRVVRGGQLGPASVAPLANCRRPPRPAIPAH